MRALNGAAAGAQSNIDPMARVLSVGPRVPVALMIVFAIMLHGGAAAGATAVALFSEIIDWNKQLQETVAAKLFQTYEVQVEKEKEPPPPPPEEPKPVVKEDTPPPPKDAPPPPPPAAAEAAKVLTQEPAKDEPVDLTGNTFVTGSGSTYAGGVTQQNGTSKTAVYNPAAVATGVPGGTGTAPAPPGPPKVDKSKVAGLLGSVDWNDCPFPPEADAEQRDQAFVMIQVKVKPDGSPETVTVIQDPGFGFGREARKCAMRKKYSQALDADGNAIGGTTKPFRVRFER